MGGQIGIGHTRWATHGAPSMINAHPHLDSKGKIALIHNGVIENYIELKNELIDKGHEFLSRTDTEIIPHLIEDELKEDTELKDAILRVLRRLKACSNSLSKNSFILGTKSSKVRVVMKSPNQIEKKLR